MIACFQVFSVSDPNSFRKQDLGGPPPFTEELGDVRAGWMLGEVTMVISEEERTVLKCSAKAFCFFCLFTSFNPTDPYL